jgi:hypothetical protein
MASYACHSHLSFHGLRLSDVAGGNMGRDVDDRTCDPQRLLASSSRIRPRVALHWARTYAGAVRETSRKSRSRIHSLVACLSMQIGLSCLLESPDYLV